MLNAWLNSFSANVGDLLKEYTNEGIFHISQLTTNLKLEGTFLCSSYDTAGNEHLLLSTNKASFPNSGRTTCWYRKEIMFHWIRPCEQRIETWIIIDFSFDLFMVTKFEDKITV